MTEPAEAAAIDGWHAHVYYDAATRERAALLREWIATRFDTRLGRWHDLKVGPHPQSMYQVAFANSQFPTLVPFLVLNRMGLTLSLIHI